MIFNFSRLCKLSIGLLLATNLISINPSYAQSVSDVINNGHEQDLKNIDVTIFAFAYGRIKEADKIMGKMIEAPSASLEQICKAVYMKNAKSNALQQLQKKALQWVYMNNALYYTQILDDINNIEKQITLTAQPENGPLSQKLVTILKKRRAILEEARKYGWTAEFLTAQLEKNDLAFDEILINSGSKIATTAFDTFYDVDLDMLPSVEKAIHDLMESNCLQDPEEQDKIEEVL